MTDVSLHLGDCLDVLKTLDANSIDSIVCDPPYGLSFMGKDWDHGVPGVAFWEAALRVAKPGAMLLAFGGTRTHHRLMVAIEDAGWEIRDCLTWLYGSGFPKSLDISKAIDKAAGAEREIVGPKTYAGGRYTAAQLDPGGNTCHEGYARPWKDDPDAVKRMQQETAPATPSAIQWQGWGTALKPAYEPIIMARKPLEGTVAANVLKWGVGGINVDACRIGHGEPEKRTFRTSDKFSGRYNGGENGHYRNGDSLASASPQGRWPANLLLDEEAASQLGDVSRYFYIAKASKRDRDEGLEGMTLQPRGQTYGLNGGGTLPQQTPHKHEPQRNHHPTVKPTALMRYLCRMVTPPNGVILDPFMGSGSTGKAAVLEGFSFVGIELEAEYLAIAERRIAEAQMQLPLLEMA